MTVLFRPLKNFNCGCPGLLGGPFCFPFFFLPIRNERLYGIDVTFLIMELTVKFASGSSACSIENLNVLRNLLVRTASFSGDEVLTHYASEARVRCKRELMKS